MFVYLFCFFALVKGKSLKHCYKFLENNSKFGVQSFWRITFFFLLIIIFNFCFLAEACQSSLLIILTSITHHLSNYSCISIEIYLIHSFYNSKGQYASETKIKNKLPVKFKYKCLFGSGKPGFAYQLLYWLTYEDIEGITEISITAIKSPKTVTSTLFLLSLFYALLLLLYILLLLLYYYSLLYSYIMYI